jgi:hypothetical protein
MDLNSKVSYIQQLVHGFNWHNPSWDLFIILFWLVGSVIYAFAAGRGRILSILISVYMAKLLVIEAPFLQTEVSKHLHGALLPLQQLVTFAILFLLLFMFLARYAFKSSADSRRMTSIAFGLVFAVLQVGLLLNIILGFLPIETQNHFTPLVHFLFLQRNAGFVWLILPVVYLVALGKFIGERSEF